MKRFMQLLLVLFIACFLACNGGNGGGDDDDDDNGSNGNGTTITLDADAIIAVLDTDWEPIPDALVGGEEYTDANGVASGTFTTTSAGWLTVEAMGYLKGFTASESSLDTVDLYQVWLTPIQQAIRLESGQNGLLAIGDEQDILYSLTVAASNFETLPVTVGLASIEPLDVWALFEPLSTGADLNLQMAFGISADDTDMEPVNLASGNNLTIRIGDEGSLSDNPVLAYFDPQTGEWEVVAGSCVRDGTQHFNCTVNAVKPLYGLFDSQAVNYLSLAGDSKLQIKPKVASDYGEAYKKALQRYRERLKELEELCMIDPNCDPQNDSELNDALDDMAEAAREFAENNQNEKGKNALGNVAGQAMRQGNNTLGDALMAEAGDIAEAMGNDLLQDVRCENIREMLNVAQQNQLMGSQAVADQLTEKIGQDLKECDLWTGKITYWMFPAAAHPCLDELTRRSGSSWTEKHSVRMTTKVTTHQLTGTDTVSLNFPSYKFQRDDDCTQSIRMYGEPPNGQTYLTFDGTYDGHTFSVTNPGPAAETVSIGQEQVMQLKNNEVCENAPGYPLSLSFPNYSSLLVHGFLDSPPITIQEMLEEGTFSAAANGRDVIHGEMTLTNECEGTNFARYPATSGNVNWRFVHIQKYLPVED